MTKCNICGTDPCEETPPEDEGFDIFQRAKATWMLKNQDKVLHNGYAESGDRAGYKAVLASLNKGTDV